MALLLTALTLAGLIAKVRADGLVSDVSLSIGWPLITVSPSVWPLSGAILAVAITIVITFVIAWWEVRRLRRRNDDELLLSPPILLTCLFARAINYQVSLTEEQVKGMAFGKARECEPLLVPSGGQWWGRFRRRAAVSRLTVQQALDQVEPYTSDNELLLRSELIFAIEDAAEVQDRSGVGTYSMVDDSELYRAAARVLAYNRVVEHGRKTLLSIGARVLLVANQPFGSMDPEKDAELKRNAAECVADRPADLWHRAAAASWWVRRGMDFGGAWLHVEDPLCMREAADIILMRFRANGSQDLGFPPIMELAPLVLGCLTLGGEEDLAREYATLILDSTPVEGESDELRFWVLTAAKNSLVLMDLASGYSVTDERLGELFGEGFTRDEMQSACEGVLLSHASSLPGAVLRDLNHTRLKSDLSRELQGLAVRETYGRLSNVFGSKRPPRCGDTAEL